MTFPQEVSDQLGCYVYRLIDPRNGETFYVGRGRSNRVFEHVRAALADASEEGDGMSLKLGRIRAIQNQLGDGSVIHVIHRHGLDDENARLVEAALIDAYPGLTNEVGGQGSADFGPAHADQLIRRYGTEPFEVGDGHRLLLITINRSFSDNELSLDDATRAAWRINVARAQRADAVLGVAFGIVRTVLSASNWRPALRSDFPFLADDVPERRGFDAVVASREFLDRYLHKRVPANLLSLPGARGPLRYNYD